MYQPQRGDVARQTEHRCNGYVVFSNYFTWGRRVTKNEATSPFSKRRCPLSTLSLYICNHPFTLSA